MKPQITDYFNDTYLKSFFEEKIRMKKGGGRDNLTPRNSYAKLEQVFPMIISKCLNGTYNFSYYNEVLVLKGKNKYPRVLSIPTVRDRLVLGVLNKYLQDFFADVIHQDIPNSYIKRIKDYLLHENSPIVCYRTDYKDFYPSIRISLLRHKLRRYNVPENVVSLIMNAIKTPTIKRDKPTKIQPNSRGVPQGLAISNILAAIYMLDFDRQFGETSCGLYLRYVDDSIFLSPKVKNIRTDLKKRLSSDHLGLRLSQEKVQYGIVGKENFDFLGYVIKNQKVISIKETKITRFLDRLSKVASRCKAQLPVYERPSFIRKDEAFFPYYIGELNDMISGFRVNNHLYGWIAYFQAMNDVALLYGMDNVIRKKILRSLPQQITDHVHSLVKSYYDILKTGGINYLEDLDSLTSVEDKKRYLFHRGRLDSNRSDYSDDFIEAIYEQYVSYKKRNAEINIGDNS